LLFACEGRDHQTVVDFCADLKAHPPCQNDLLHLPLLV